MLELFKRDSNEGNLSGEDVRGGEGWYGCLFLVDVENGGRCAAEAERFLAPSITRSKSNLSAQLPADLLRPSRRYEENHTIGQSQGRHSLTFQPQQRCSIIYEAIIRCLQA